MFMRTFALVSSPPIQELEKKRARALLWTMVEFLHITHDLQGFCGWVGGQPLVFLADQHLEDFFFSLSHNGTPQRRPSGGRKVKHTQESDHSEHAAEEPPCTQVPQAGGHRHEQATHAQGEVDRTTIRHGAH
jgi:hypothetical protein